MVILDHLPRASASSTAISQSVLLQAFYGACQTIADLLTFEITTGEVQTVRNGFINWVRDYESLLGWKLY
jgi:hypothetical protein